MFFQKATKIDEIFTADLTLSSKCQINGEDFINFCGLLRNHELYQVCFEKKNTLKFSGDCNSLEKNDYTDKNDLDNSC